MEENELIVGVGAVGAFFAYELLASGAQVIGVVRKNPSTRSVQSYQVRFEESGFVQNFVLPVMTYQDLKKHQNKLKVHRLFVCVPHDQVSSALVSLVALHLCVQHVVLCSNGLISQENVNFCQSLSPYVWRALVFAGFSKQDEVIFYKGGTKVVWGYLGAGGNQTLYYDVAQGFRYLRWQWSDNIKRVEILKIFVNFILAKVIRNRMLPNKSFWELYVHQDVERFIQFLVETLPLGLCCQDFWETLEHTIRDTAENINSISFAWGQKQNFQPWEFLCSQLRELIQPYKNHPDYAWALAYIA